jgi:uncharacterized Zn-finger protein
MVELRKLVNAVFVSRNSEINNIWKHISWLTWEKSQTNVRFVITDALSSSIYLKRQHNMTHTGEKPIGCEVCGSKFADGSSMRKHASTHDRDKENKPYKCDICQCSFSQKSGLTVHMMLHTGEKPVKCYVCDYGCTTKLSLKYHM